MLKWHGKLMHNGKEKKKTQGSAQKKNKHKWEQKRIEENLKSIEKSKQLLEHQDKYKKMWSKINHCSSPRTFRGWQQSFTWCKRRSASCRYYQCYDLEFSNQKRVTSRVTTWSCEQGKKKYSEKKIWTNH